MGVELGWFSPFRTIAVLHRDDPNGQEFPAVRINLPQHEIIEWHTGMQSDNRFSWGWYGTSVPWLGTSRLWRVLFIVPLTLIRFAEKVQGNGSMGKPEYLGRPKKNYNVGVIHQPPSCQQLTNFLSLWECKFFLVKWQVLVRSCDVGTPIDSTASF